MSKKTITIEVPDGLPDGWECVGYGLPVAGETMHHDLCGWKQTTLSKGLCYLIARRVETAADWANKQPKLSVLASMLDDHRSLCLDVFGRHISENGMPFTAEKCSEVHARKIIVSKSGKWVNA